MLQLNCLINCQSPKTDNRALFLCGHIWPALPTTAESLSVFAFDLMASHNLNWHWEQTCGWWRSWLLIWKQMKLPLKSARHTGERSVHANHADESLSTFLNCQHCSGVGQWLINRKVAGWRKGWLSWKGRELESLNIHTYFFGGKQETWSLTIFSRNRANLKQCSLL